MASTLRLALANIWMNDYSALVILTAVGYDYVLTFSDEIEYIWNKPWTRVSTLFVLARYFGLCSAAINAIMGCSFLPGPEMTLLKNIQGEILDVLYFWAGCIFMSAAERPVSMILRVSALYNRWNVILYMLLASYVIEVIPYLILCIMISSLNRPTAVIVRVLDFSYCDIQYYAPTWTLIVCGAQIVLGALMCLLVVIQLFREVLQMYRTTKRVHLNLYVKLLVQEGMVYFLVIVTYAVINMQVYQGSGLLGGWQVIVIGIVAAIPPYTLVPRFILNLRKLYTRDLRGGTDIDTGFGLSPAGIHGTALGTIRFLDVEENEGWGRGEEIQMEAREEIGLECAPGDV